MLICNCVKVCSPAYHNDSASDSLPSLTSDFLTLLHKVTWFPHQLEFLWPSVEGLLLSIDVSGILLPMLSGVELT